MTLRGIGDDSIPFSQLTADQQAAWLMGQTAAETGSVPFSQMSADQQTEFLNQSGFNSLTPAQQSALLNTLNSTTATEWIQGVPNNYILIGGAVLLLLLVMGGRK